MNFIKTYILPRRILAHNICFRFNSQAAFKFTDKRTDQVDYLKSLSDHKSLDWNEIRSTVFNKDGNLNSKNVDAVILRIIVNDKKFTAAQSFTKFLKASNTELSLGVINGLLHFYFEYSKEHCLSSEEKHFVLNMYDNLYKRFKFLDHITCERLINALCCVDEWQKSLKVLDDIYLSSTPSHSTYSTIIATLFRNNKEAEALELIKSSLSHRRPLLDNAYEEWIKYILRTSKDKKSKLKNLEAVCLHISNNFVVMPEKTAEIFKETFISLGWDAKFTKIEEKSGKCNACATKLDCLKLSEDEFSVLQKNVQEKLIIGSDLFLKTSPDELKRFLNFIKSTAPYDIVLDALNIAYAGGMGLPRERLKILFFAVEYFASQNKKILVLGRNHMLKWKKGLIDILSKNAYIFFTEDVSQDDPFFITAAILSGSNTDIVSKDLLRNHSFLLGEDHLRTMFRLWQWQHQWMVQVSRRTPVITAPLRFTPCGQRNERGWHFPYERKKVNLTGQYNNLVSDCSSWLCLRAPTNNQ